MANKKNYVWTTGAALRLWDAADPFTKAKEKHPDWMVRRIVEASIAVMSTRPDRLHREWKGYWV